MTKQHVYPGKPKARLLNEIADEIADEWDDIPSEADDLVSTLRLCEHVGDSAGDGTAGQIVRKLLILSTEWHSDAAKRIKRELRGKLGLH